MDSNDSGVQKQEAINPESRSDSGEDILHVKIYSPYQVYYDATAQSISAENDTGAFDILPRHHNFMTLVNACEVVIRRTNADDTRIKISRGVMHVRSNKVTLFLDV